jgi:hypothetical protein
MGLGSEIRGPRYGKNLFRIPDPGPGVKKSQDPGSGVRNTDQQEACSYVSISK